MNWTKARPTQPGWYWFKASPTDEVGRRELFVGRRGEKIVLPNPVLVEEDKQGHLLASFGIPSYSHRVDELSGEWAGPLKEPDLDYRALLKRYMRMVMETRGSVLILDTDDFVRKVPQRGDFLDEGLAELRKIEQEVIADIRKTTSP